MKPSLWNGIALAAGVVLVFALGPWLARELRTLPRAHELAARSDQKIVALEVAGMTCDVCAGKIHTELSAVPGVSTADVRLRENRAYVVCDKAVTDTALTTAVTRAGPGYLGAVIRP